MEQTQVRDDHGEPEGGQLAWQGLVGQETALVQLVDEIAQRPAHSKTVHLHIFLHNFIINIYIILEGEKFYSKFTLSTIWIFSNLSKP